MDEWTKENDEELKKFLNEIDIKNMCSWLLRFSPAELPVISSAIGLLLMNELTGREMLVLGNFVNNIGSVLNLQAQQKLLIKEASRVKVDRLNVIEEQHYKDIAKLQQELNKLKWIIKNK